MTENFRGLKVYQKAYSVIMEIYKASAMFPREELYGITSQIRRASVSVALNIAEGYGRKDGSSKDYRQFLIISKGSCNEVQVLLEICKDLKYIESGLYTKLIEATDETAKMLQGLIKSLN